MMTHILSNFPQEYQTIIYILEDKLYYEYNPLAIESIRDRFLVKYYWMNDQSRPIMLWEDVNTFTSNPSTRVPAWLAVDTVTSQRTSGIENSWTYQNVITVTNPYMSRDTVTRESRNKIQGGKKEQR